MVFEFDRMQSSDSMGQHSVADTMTPRSSFCLEQSCLKDGHHTPPKPVIISTGGEAGRVHRTRAWSKAFGRSYFSKTLNEQVGSAKVMAKIIFRNMIDVQALRERVGAEVLQHPRFSAKLVRAPDSKKGVADCAFEEVAEVDMAYHVREIDCVGWEQAELDEYLEKIDTTEMDLERPLWEIRVLNGLELSSGTTNMALCWINHTIGDGQSLAGVLASLFDSATPAGVPAASSISDGLKSLLVRDDAPRGALLERQVAGTDMACSVVLKMVSIAMVPLMHLKYVSAVLSILADPIVTRDDTSNSLKVGKLADSSKHRVTGESGKIPVERFKEVTLKLRELSGERYTINDVLTAVLSLTIQRYYAERGDAILNNPEGVKVGVPLSMRSGPVVTDVWNDIVMAVIKLPFGLTPVQTTMAAKRSMDGVKSSFKGLLERSLFGLICRNLDDKQSIDFVNKTFSKFSLISSNVILPREKAEICGNTVEDISFFVYVRTGTYAGLKSYAGNLSCTFTVDTSLAPDMHTLTGSFVPAFESLYAETMSAIKMPPRPSSDRSFTAVAVLFLAASCLAAWACQGACKMLLDPIPLMP